MPGARLKNVLIWTGKILLAAALVTAWSLFLCLMSCQKESEPISGPAPTPYRFHPSASPIPTPRTTPAVKPTPLQIKQVGWIQVQASRWEAAKTRPEKVHFAHAIAAQIIRNRTRYETVSQQTGVPWQIIGAIHSLEADLDFRSNLANGDPLTARTRHVPSGRPPDGKPPFDWTTAAADALIFDDMDKKNWTSIGNWLQNAELYNGPFYEKHGLISPYIHSWDTLYFRGKIVADGRYSASAVSAQCGVVPILRELLPASP
jgi:lysozyme family protein